ncbi:hypothetical protein Tco_1250922 [Tanacetum coccineum]
MKEKLFLCNGLVRSNLLYRNLKSGDSIRIVNSFSKVIDEMNKSTTNHAARVDRNLRSDYDLAIRVSLNPKSGVTYDGSSKVSNSSPLVSPSTTINVPRELYSIDVAATFGVPLTTVGDLHKLITDIEASKHDELLSEMTNDDRMETDSRILTPFYI